MTSRFAGLVLLGLLFCGAVAQDRPSLQTLLDTAHKNADLSSLGSYVMTGALVVNPGTKKEVAGTVAFYRDHDHARVDLQIANRTETRISIGQMDYFDPAGILVAGTWLSELDRLWDPERTPKGVFHPAKKWGAPSSRKIDGQKAWCVETERDPKERLCFDAARNLLLASTHYEFSGYTMAGQIFLPGKIVINEPYAAPIEIRNIKVDVYPADQHLFDVPAHAMEIENCENGSVPQGIDTSLPAHSEYSMVTTRANLALYLFVDKQGQVAEAKMLSSVSRGFDAEVMNAVKKWRFKPASCGDRAVNFPVMLEMNGQLSSKF